LDEHQKQSGERDAGEEREASGSPEGLALAAFDCSSVGSIKMGPIRTGPKNN
jgi:hypothetical protein